MQAGGRWFAHGWRGKQGNKAALELWRLLLKAYVGLFPSFVGRRIYPFFIDGHSCPRLRKLNSIVAAIAGDCGESSV